MNCIRWIETIAGAIFVYQQTGIAFLVALMTLLRLLPMSLLGAFIGGMTDRLNRRTAMIIFLVTGVTTSGTLLALAHFGLLQVWHLGLASLIGGIGWAADHPVRRMMIAEVVGIDRLGVAMSIDAGANQTSRIAGPALGGLLLAMVGITGCFALELALSIVALVAALGISRAIKTKHAAPVRIFSHVADGLRAAWRDERVRAALLVTVVFNMFVWPCLSMVPVIGKDQLHLDPGGVGILASMEGIGALLGSTTIGILSRPAHSAALYFGGCMMGMFAMVFLALSSTPLAAGAALLTFGFFGAGFSIMQATLIYRLAPPELRGRVLGLISVCIGVGPIGFLQLGILADLIGAADAVIATAMTGFVVAVLLFREWKALLRA